MTLHRVIGIFLALAGLLALVELASIWAAVNAPAGWPHVDMYAHPGTQILVTEDGYAVPVQPGSGAVIVPPGVRVMEDVFLGGMGVVALTAGLVLLFSRCRTPLAPPRAVP